MVDIVTNRMFDAFSKLAPSGKQQNDSLSTISHLKRFSAEQRYQKAINREAEAKAREDQLFYIKENVPPVSAPKNRPLGGLTCYGCAPVSRDSLVNKATKNLPLKNILYEYPAVAKTNGLLYRIFSHILQCYAVDSHNYVQVAGSVLKDPYVQNGIEKASLQQFQESENQDDEYYQRLWIFHEKRAHKLLHDMRSTLSDFLLKFTSWVLYKLLPCFLSAVVVHSGQLDMLKKASKNGLPLIFLPLHRSHLDYVMISFILYNNNIPCPLIASGDNLRMPVFGSLLRGLGAFYIKRRIDPIMGQKDYVYKAVLHSYMNACLKVGHNIEFFLEGGRSRTGKPLIPKYGIFSVVMDAVLNGTIDDAYLIPVSINYDKLVDGNFVREQLGQSKQMESFSSAVTSIWHVLKSDYGMVKVDFNQPISIKEMMDTFNATRNTVLERKLPSNPSTVSLYGTDVVSEEHRDLVEKISKHVIYDCSRSTSVMATNAISFLLLHKYRNGITLEELSIKLDILRNDLLKKQKDVGFSGESIDVINYAVKILGPNLVQRQEKNGQIIIKPKADLPSIIELNYYSNTLVSYFCMESLISVALHSMDLHLGFVQENELLQECLELCKIFVYEYIFCRPCQSEECALLDCLEELTISKEIFTIKNANTVEAERSRRMAELFDDFDRQYIPTKEYIINKSEDSIEFLSLMKSLLMPFIESYSVTATCLQKLVGKSLLESELIQTILNEMREQLQQGSIKYGESVSSESVKNALKLFQKWNILQSHAEGKLRLYYLHEFHDNEEGVQQLCSRINKYRSSSININ